MRENRAGVKVGVVWMSALVLAVGVLFTSIAGRAQAPRAGDPVVDWRQSKIVFWSERDGDEEIYVMNADGSNQHRLTNRKGGDEHPSWSPDGKRIAFSSWGREDGLRVAIFAMDPDGSNVTRLSKNTGRQDAPRFPGDRALAPSWSPDGKRILFNSDRDGNEELFVMDADGSNVQRLTNAPTPGSGTSSTDPVWSPDGNWIAFDSNRDGRETEIYMMSSDGSNVKRLTDTPGKQRSSNPDWSPDGKRIAFNSTRDRSSGSDNWFDFQEIYTMDTDGSNVRRVTHTSDKGHSSSHARWSPDGKKFAFLSGSSASAGTYTAWFKSQDIYVMDVDGSNVQRLTFAEGFDGNLNWQPTRR